MTDPVNKDDYDETQDGNEEMKTQAPPQVPAPPQTPAPKIPQGWKGSFEPSYVLGMEGPIAASLDNYEVREPQVFLANDIRKAFEENVHLVAEAATGTGKSFAAILAAVEKSVMTGCKVVISTHTIALQEQLFNKDIPFLLRRLKLPLDVVLAKGRGNYLSLRRTKIASKKMNKHSDTQKQYQHLIRWLPTAKSENKSPPSKSSLPFVPSASLWAAVRSDSDDCMGEKCPTFKTCHYQSARKQLENASIIITNHTMVMLDRKMKAQGIQGVLPDYQYLILDEAHEIEGVARQVFTFELKEYDIKGVMSEIYSDDGSGILNPIYDQYANGSILDILNKTVVVDPKKQLVMDTVKSIELLLVENDSYFEKVEKYLGQKNIRRFIKADAIPNKLFDSFKVMLGYLKDLIKHIPERNAKQKIEYVQKRGTEIAMGLDKIMTLPTNGKYPEVVAWAASKYNSFKKSKTLSVVCAPIFLKPLMKKLVFNPLNSVVLMSATLASGGKDPFRMIKSILGLDEPMQRKLPSVFDYKKQVKTYIVRDMPEQKDEAYIPTMITQVDKYVSASKGGAFVLFTSFDTMKKVYEGTKDSFLMQNFDLFLQGGTLDRTRMIDSFKETKHGVLFGVASFWTGVDIPGNSLRNLIITKLPFTPPDDPLQQAQEEVYKQYKRNYFMERAVPQTAIMLKQGFGRLIRRKSDTGSVVLLDSRLVSKPYGKILINSLPACDIRYVSCEAPVKRK